MPDFDGGSVFRRPRAQQVNTMPLSVDVDPPPTPWPFAPALAGLAVMFFLSLQFLLPVTHVRHPADPHRNWIPVDQLKASTQNKIVSDFDSMWSFPEGGKETLIVIISKETDLRPVFVVLNSTISNTMEPEKLHFLIILPSSLSKLQSLKLQAIFSNLKVDILRDKLVIEKMKAFMVPEITSENILNVLDVVPFYLPKLFPGYARFIHLESDAVLQGDIEELIQMDMQGNPVASVEDCTQNFETSFSMDLLEAARLSSGKGKPKMPSEPYGAKTCLFDKGTLVVDRKVWSEKNVTEVLHWWISMHHKTGESLYSNGHLELPVNLALYQEREKLDASWNVREPLNLAKTREAKLVHFDKQHKPWHQAKPTNFEKDISGLWWKYLSPSTNMVFNSQ